MSTIDKLMAIVEKYPQEKQAGILLRLIRRDAKEKSKNKRMHTQIWLGNMVGVSNIWICMIETGRVQCSIILAKRIAKIYRINYKLLRS